MRPLSLRVITLVLALGGAYAMLRWAGTLHYLYPIEIILGTAAILLGAQRPIARQIQRMADGLEHLTPPRHALFVAMFGIVILAHIYIAALRGHRFLVPLIHDEQMYLTQARQMASGHLSMPAHAYPEFFDTFYVLTHPVYASMYFPGTALFYVPAVWLHLPWAAWPLMTTTLLVLMTYLVAARVLNRAAGVVCAIALLGIDAMNYVPTMTMSHPVGGLLGMAMVYSWLRWREQLAWQWVIFCGVASGWMLITRPLEGCAFTIPIVLAVVARIRLANYKRVLPQIVAAAAVATPFIAIQLAFDHQVTGQWLKLPINLYVEQEFPALTSMGGVRGDPSLAQTTSKLAQKQRFFKIFVLPNNLAHLNETTLEGISWRAKSILGTSMSHPLFALLLPLGLLLLATPTGRVLWGIVFLYVAGYRYYNAYLSQYSVQIAPIFLIIAFGSVKALCTAFPRQIVRIESIYLATFTVLSLETLVIMPNTGLANYDWYLQQINYVDFPKLIKKPAIVFIHYDPASSPHIEMVYNLEAANPDDARIIRVHDLGPAENRKLIDYYAKRQPWREVYFFDRGKLGPPRDAGNVAELAHRLDQPATAAATRAAN